MPSIMTNNDTKILSVVMPSAVMKLSVKYVYMKPLTTRSTLGINTQHNKTQYDYKNTTQRICEA
jgi:hypothetical protein